MLRYISNLGRRETYVKQPEPEPEPEPEPVEEVVEEVAVVPAGDSR